MGPRARPILRPPQAGNERTGKRSERHEQVELQVRHVTLSGVEVVDVDGLQIAEEHDENRQARSPIPPPPPSG